MRATFDSLKMIFLLLLRSFVESQSISAPMTYVSNRFGTAAVTKQTNILETYCGQIIYVIADTGPNVASPNAVESVSLLDAHALTTLWRCVFLRLDLVR
jgi:hypothetical protein